MVRSMMSGSNLPQFLWGEVLKTSMYILNCILTLAIQFTSFELFKGCKPSLNHIKIQGCPIEVRLYNPTLGKLDPRTIRCYFVSYQEHSKGYQFYNSYGGPKIVDSQTTKFLELDATEKAKCSQSIRSKGITYINVEVEPFISLSMQPITLVLVHVYL